VNGRNGNGYVELPYTLVQDSTLFVMLEEKAIDIWKRKLEWIASRGGMALLTVHPDYVTFDGEEPQRDEYPVAHYTEFISWVKQDLQRSILARRPERGGGILSEAKAECDFRFASAKFIRTLDRSLTVVDKGAIIQQMSGMGAHLDALENQSIFIFREANHAFKNIAMPWSMGKDSNVLLWLALKAFFGKIPFPLLHIDTTYEFPEMLAFREWAITHYGVRVIVKINTEARARGIGYETHDPVTVTHELKTVALKQAIAEHGWDALVTGIRRDEDPTRAKERYFLTSWCRF
jgi:hypothetical protein